MRHDTALDLPASLIALPRLTLATYPTPVERLERLRVALGGGPAILVKRDDAIGFGFGGNKIRKLEFVAAQALADGADTLVTTGSIQSNHCRATAAVAARLGMGCVLVQNGVPPSPPTANFLLGGLFGAQVEIVGSRADRANTMVRVLERLRVEGRRAAAVPLGASTALGALGYALALVELVQQGVRPDVIVLPSSSGGTQAGLIVGSVLTGHRLRIVGVSPDDEAPRIAGEVDALAAESAGLIGLSGPLAQAEVEGGFIGGGYGVPSPESTRAAALFARCEGLLLDPTYTAKAAAALIALVREGQVPADATVLFWHTGGLPLIFA